MAERGHDRGARLLRHRPRRLERDPAPAQVERAEALFFSSATPRSRSARRTFCTVIPHVASSSSLVHVLSPRLPVGYAQGQKFSIYTHSECWNRDELELTAQHATKVWSLELHGEDFDDVVVGSLPALKGMHVLGLERSPLNGPGLSGLSKHPLLCRLRLSLNHQGPFSADDLPKLRPLETFTIENLPVGPFGLSTVAARATRLESLSISTAHDLVLDAPLQRPLSSLSLSARSIEGDPLPKKVASLHLHLRAAGDDDLERLLARVKAVSHLSLRGTPVTEEFVETIVSRWNLESLDVVHTRVSDECVRRIRARHPKLRIQPNPDFDLTRFRGHS